MTEAVHKKHKLLWIVITIVAVLIVAGGGGGYYFYHQHQVAVAKEKAAEKLIKEEKSYKEKFMTALDDINIAYMDTKIVTNAYNSALDTEADFTTSNNAYSLLNPNFIIKLANNDLKDNGDLDTMNSEDSTVTNDMSALSNPPKIFNNVSDRLNIIYGDYRDLYSLTSNAESSTDLVNFKDQTTQLISKINLEYNEISTSIPAIHNK